MNERARRILWVDCGAAAAAGVVVLALSPWVARFYGFPRELVLFFGVANVAYASYSGSLAVRARRGAPVSVRAIDALIGANFAWVMVCGVVLARMWSSATAFGLAHAGLEALFVGSLAVAELRSVRPFAASRGRGAAASRASGS